MLIFVPYLCRDLMGDKVRLNLKDKLIIKLLLSNEKNNKSCTLFTNKIALWLHLIKSKPL